MEILKQCLSINKEDGTKLICQECLSIETDYYWYYIYFSKNVITLCRNCSLKFYNEVMFQND